MIPHVIIEAAERDAVLTALLHLRSRGVLRDAEVYERYIQLTRRAIVRWCNRLRPETADLARLFWLIQAHGADDVQTVLWLSWLAGYTGLAMVHMQERGLLPWNGDIEP